MTKYLLTLAALSFLIPSHALSWSGTVTTTASENSLLTVRRGSKQITIRLYGLKPPDAEHSFASQAKTATISLVKGREVTVNELTTDEQGQPVALVYINGQNLNKHLIQEGYALVDTELCKENFCSTWISIEVFSRLQGRGIWAENKK